MTGSLEHQGVYTAFGERNGKFFDIDIGFGGGNKHKPPGNTKRHKCQMDVGDGVGVWEIRRGG